MANVQMPRLSDSMETGKILRWLKKEGEEVKKGEPLVEIESDKANIEVEAYASGKLSKIVVPEGESAPIGAVIAEIGDGGAAPRTEKPAGPEGQAPAAEAEPKSKPVSAEAPKAQAAKPEAHVAQADKAMAATAQQAADSGGEQDPPRGPDDRTESRAAGQGAVEPDPPPSSSRRCRPRSPCGSPRANSRRHTSTSPPRLPWTMQCASARCSTRRSTSQKPSASTTWWSRPSRWP